MKKEMGVEEKPEEKVEEVKEKPEEKAEEVKEEMKEKTEVKEEVKKEEKKEEKPAAKPSIPVDSEGKPVRIDNNWKQFMAKHGGKKPAPKTSQKRKEVPKNNQPQAKKRTLLDDSEEVHSSKKIPLTKKVPLRK